MLEKPVNSDLLICKNSPSNRFWLFGDTGICLHKFHYKNKIGFPSHLHDVSSLVVCLEGAVECVQFGHREVLTAGEAIITTAGVFHASTYCVNGMPTSGIVIDVPVTLLRHLWRLFCPERPVEGLPVLRGKIAHSELASEAASLVKYLESEQLPFLSLVVRIATLALKAWPAELVGERSPAVEPQLACWRLTYLIDQMHSLPRAGFYLADAARQVGLSSSHLRLLFRNSTGTSPQQCFQMAVAERACELLSQRDLTVREIAGRLGFEHPSHFCSFFRQRFGTSPGRYRRRPACR